jgi:hypothetical protein
LKLLVGLLAEVGLAESICSERLRVYLKNRSQALAEAGMVGKAEISSDYGAAMEGVLDLNEEPYYAALPVGDFDETSRQLKTLIRCVMASPRSCSSAST